MDSVDNGIFIHAIVPRHVETVVLLSQQKPDLTIHVGLPVAELEITAREARATYEKIKDYVLTTYGIKVSSLYISQVKRMHGLPVGKNYNNPKNPERKQPQCPPDKEAAILDALSHFKML